MTTQLTPSQQLILSHAAKNADGKLDWFPDNIKGGARKKVLDSMLNRALITALGDAWLVAAEGYDALGVPRPGAVKTVALDPVITSAETAQHDASQVLADEVGGEDPTDTETEAAATTIEPATSAKSKAPRTRDNSKQAMVIAMLKRPEGATIPQICEATQWQSHTVRGTFAGAFTKKLGLNLISDKGEGDRVYRIAD